MAELVTFLLAMREPEQTYLGSFRKPVLASPASKSGPFYLPMKELTCDEAHRLFRYDAETGELYWRVSRGTAKAGDAAGAVYVVCRTQYRRVFVRGKNYRVHRVIWLMHHGAWPENDIDHIDGDGLNNRIENLRDVSDTVNQRNRRMQQNNTSGVNGVYWYKKAGKWMARSRNGSGRLKHIGYYDDIRAAERAVIDYQASLGFSERHGKGGD